MRLHANHWLAPFVQVFYRGQKLERVIEADGDEGVVTVLAGGTPQTHFVNPDDLEFRIADSSAEALRAAEPDRKAERRATTHRVLWYANGRLHIRESATL